MLRVLRPAMLSAAIAVALPACYKPSPGNGGSAKRMAAGQCPEPAPGPRERWNKRVRSSATSTLVGDPHHAASDPVVNPGNDAVVYGKFAYGAVSKDLSGEDVSLWLEMRPCGSWAEITRQRTDSDGRASFTVPARLIPKPGAYRFQLIVRGDLSRTDGSIYVLARGTKVVVFDIDGTLTTGDDELVEQLALGLDPEVRPGAVATVRLYARAGYLPIYITGRPYMMRDSSRDWLRRYGFPRGVVVTTDRVGDASPSSDGVGRFKQESLVALVAGPRVEIAAAYGNAATDVCAYAQAGIDPRRTYIVGKNRGQACGGYAETQPVYDYRDHVKTLAAVPPSD
jgi:phosphatidate phosphatase PAH1